MIRAVRRAALGLCVLFGAGILTGCVPGPASQSLTLSQPTQVCTSWGNTMFSLSWTDATVPPAGSTTSFRVWSLQLGQDPGNWTIGPLLGNPASHSTEFGPVFPRLPY